MWSVPRRCSDFSTLSMMLARSTMGVASPSRTHVTLSDRPHTLLASTIPSLLWSFSHVPMYWSVLPCVAASTGTGYISACAGADMNHWSRFLRVPCPRGHRARSTGGRRLCRTALPQVA